MKTLLGRAAFVALLAAVTGVTLAAPVPLQTETIKDAKDFIPYRKYESLPGKVIGVMVSDVAAVMSHDGRGGPQDAIAFSRNNGSYRWVYTVDEKTPIITALQVKTGEKGDRVKIYPKLNMANPRTVQPFKLEAPYTLVEMEVNDGLGAPADESFVGTTMRRLDRTKEFPLDVTKVVAEMKKKYEEHKKTSAATVDLAMTAAQKKWIKDQKPTGPREVQELMYLSWDAKAETLQVRFRTKQTDGAFTEVQGGGPRFDPPPLPPRPGAGPGLAANPPQLAPPQIARPPIRNFRVGTSFGIEYGAAYEVDKDGELVRIQVLPPKDFGAESQQVPVPIPGPGPGPGRLPRPIEP
jgi:hypothetical protein